MASTSQGTAALKLPPKRRYQPIKEIQTEMEAALAEAQAPDESLDLRETAALVDLPARLRAGSVSKVGPGRRIRAFENLGQRTLGDDFASDLVLQVNSFLA